MYSIEVDDLRHFAPERADDFFVNIRLLIGPSDGPGEESFDVIVCTPKWIERECQKYGVVVGRHRFIVACYDFDLIETTIRKLITGTAGDSWQKVAEKIARYAYWEFEDYKE